MKTFTEFVCAVYAAATPSVDFEAAEHINCTDHTLSLSKYEEILNDFAGDNEELRLGCNMFMCDKGPNLVEG